MNEASHEKMKLITLIEVAFYSCVNFCDAIQNWNTVMCLFSKNLHFKMELWHTPANIQYRWWLRHRGARRENQKIWTHQCWNDPHGGNAYLIDSWLFKDYELQSQLSFSSVSFCFRLLLGLPFWQVSRREGGKTWESISKFSTTQL